MQKKPTSKIPPKKPTTPKKAVVKTVKAATVSKTPEKPATPKRTTFNKELKATPAPTVKAPAKPTTRKPAAKKTTPKTPAKRPTTRKTPAKPAEVEVKKVDEGREADGKFKEGNVYATGRKPVFSDGDSMAEKILEYFEWIKGEFEIHEEITITTKGKGKEAVTTEERTPVKIWLRNPEQPSITGIAIYLGFESRQSLYDYAKKDGFSYPIKRALLEVENNYEKGLWGDKIAGVVFALKNMGWADNLKLGEDPEAPFSFTKFLIQSSEEE